MSAETSGTAVTVARRSAAIAPQEWETRLQLAACYRMFARRNMDDAIFTHLSVRIPGRDNRFLFIPFGMLFDEVTVSNLIEVDFDGNAISSDRAVNPAGWVVHKVVYQAIPDAGSVMHFIPSPARRYPRRNAGCCRSISSASPFTVRLPITTTMVPDCGRRSSEISCATLVAGA